MNQKKGKSPRERMVCFCYSVTESTIVEAIRGGCTSLMDIRRETYASTGCAGCTEEVKKLLKKHVGKITKPQETPTPANQDPEKGKAQNG